MAVAYPIPAVQGYAGQRWGYRLSEPLRTTDLDDETYDYEFIVISSGGENVQAFPGNEDGKIIDWHELHTAPLGTDPTAVLSALGYEIGPAA